MLQLGAHGQLILQGYEARSWSLVIGENTGRMSLAVAGEDDGFVLFGTCMAPQRFAIKAGWGK